MNTLVTGAAGFIGSHMVDLLLNHGHSVIAVDDVSDNLIIGSTSQLSHYFPTDFTRVSAREWENRLGELTARKWNTVFMCFGENRTSLADTKDKKTADLFWDINYSMVVRAVDAFAPISKKVIVYSTAELWNGISGPIRPHDPFQFKPNHYIMSKYDMTIHIRNKKKYPNVSVAYPFNFNGVHRQGDFLFGKVFRSVLNKERIVLGDTYHYRDILHPSIVAIDSSLHPIGEDFIIGSGRLTFVNDLIRRIYSHFGMRYEDMVSESWDEPSQYRSRMFYSASSVLNLGGKSVEELMISELEKTVSEKGST